MQRSAHSQYLHRSSSITYSMFHFNLIWEHWMLGSDTSMLHGKKNIEISQKWVGNCGKVGIFLCQVPFSVLELWLGIDTANCTSLPFPTATHAHGRMISDYACNKCLDTGLGHRVNLWFLLTYTSLRSQRNVGLPIPWQLYYRSSPCR